MRAINIKTNLFILLVLLVATLFCFGEKSWATGNIKITAIQYDNGEGKADEDFIEITNVSENDINLKGYRLVKRSSLSSKDTSIKSWTSDTIIQAGKKHIWANSSYAIEADSKTTATISRGNGIALRFGKIDEGEIIDSINWKVEEEEEEEEEEEIKPKDYTGKLKINEIFPAPKTKNSGKEFVEIVNLSGEPIDLSGMRIEDEKNHKVSFPGETIKPKDFFILEGNFELNNTSPDTAFLIAKDGTKENPIDLVSYEKPKYDYSYAFNGSAWQWTSQETKGAKNQFDELLSGKIKKDKKIYANVYANFEAKTNSKAKKFTWNFGDGHKSYLKKTKHKYEKSGTYKASLKITGEGEENLLSFTVKVEKFGKAKVQIISLSPNPKGKDTENEWLEIFNGTKKKINLKGWSVASGWEKLSNHPIRKSFILKAGETKKLTRDFCAFSLGNKKSKIELRYPNGKVADKIKYDRKNNSILENEIYQREGGKWQWIEQKINPPFSQNDLEIKIQPELETPSVEIMIETKTEELEKADFNLSDLGKSSEDPAWQKKQEKQIALLFSGSNISLNKLLAQNQGQVLGISTAKFNSEKSTTTKSSNSFWKKINAHLNQFILLF